ncbi:MAG: ABC transporter ATP-binding protein [Burkholderiaceae bacterium]|nr:ABC transporter ATP-binding protein [Burkholderiaceae bacterium]
MDYQSSDVLLEVKDLSIEFPTAAGVFRAVDQLSFSIKAGQTLAIVGESGSGKSVTSMALMRLLDYTSGRIVSGQMLFGTGQDRQDLAKADDATMRRLRGNEISMIFQEPMTSLDPVFTIGSQIMEALILHQQMTSPQARQAALAMLEKVRMPDAGKMLDRYPHQLSGGMRQRVMIAMALSCRPKLLIADEPTTALDVTIQAQILNLIRELQQDFGTAVIFITHDMGVVAEIAQDVVVMWKGRKVEQGTVQDIFQQPSQPYTKALLAAVPRLGQMRGLALPKRTPVVHFLDNGELETIGSESLQDTVKGDTPVLRVENLSTRFDVAHNFFGRTTYRVHAVEQVSFNLYPGETLALVGESGSGKTTVGKSIQQLVVASSGAVFFNGQDIFKMSKADQRRLKRDIQYVFQDPYASLDPRKTIEFSIAEPIVTHNILSDKQAIKERVAQLLLDVGLKPEHAARYPHEFSGGQRQRICIARALACDPKLIIADESVSALDVSTQAQIVDLLMGLQQQRGLAYLFITHDMAVVEKISHRVAVLYLGQLVELGSRQAVFESPRHSYTRTLLSAVPVAIPGRHIDTDLIVGDIPSVVRSVDDMPVIHPLFEVAPGHWVASETA